MRALFKLFAFTFFAAAAFHFAGLLTHVSESPLWRNALFVVIDLFCVFGFLRRPWYFPLFFAALTVQQYTSHGASLLRAMSQGHIAWLDASVVLFMTTALVFLFIGRHRSAQTSA